MGLRYPVGIQSFREMITGGYAYVDKTAEVYHLVHNAKYVFLSRPRRFGKSLLLSTIEAYLSGNCSLFAELKMADLHKGEWPCHPVLYFDMNPGIYDSERSLDVAIGLKLAIYEKEYGLEAGELSIADRLYALIGRAHEATGQKVVVLVDEYDKPVLDALGDRHLADHNRRKLRGFYGVLKSCDGHIRFAMLTGVGNMGNIDVFSGLNNMEDISLAPKYSCLCGISEQEIRGSWRCGVEALAAECGLDVEEAYRRLRKMYGGYHFARDLREVYNPFGVLKALKTGDIQDYWFQTGTPTHLVGLLMQAELPVTKINGSLCSMSELANGDIASGNLLPTLYYTGYLTIGAYDPEYRTFYLIYPNEDARTGLLHRLLERLTGYKSARTNSAIRAMRECLGRDDMDGFLEEVRGLLARTPYDLAGRNEAHYQDVLYTIGMLLGMDVQAETKTSEGRIDMLLGTRNCLYVMEFKLDGSAAEAMDQIDSRHYLLPYRRDGRRLVRVGVNFSSSTRTIDTWLIR